MLVADWRRPVKQLQFLSWPLGGGSQSAHLNLWLCLAEGVADLNQKRTWLLVFSIQLYSFDHFQISQVESGSAKMATSSQLSFKTAFQETWMTSDVCSSLYKVDVCCPDSPYLFCCISLHLSNRIFRLHQSHLSVPVGDASLQGTSDASIWTTSSVSLMFLPPDTLRRQQHSSWKPPAWHIRAVSQWGLPGTGGVRGVCLPQRQDLPLSCRDQLHLPGHEQHLPLELTWEQCLRARTFCTPALELERLRRDPLYDRKWKRAESWYLDASLSAFRSKLLPAVD